MAARIQIPARPEVLRWARETSGHDLSSAAHKLGISVSELVAIEQGAAAVPPQVFSRMRTTYGRIESVLLLPEPPEEDELPRDYRTVAGARPTLSPETLFAIREGRRIQQYVSELLEDDDSLLPKADIPRASIDIDPESLAVEERTHFGITPDVVRRWKPGAEAFARWRDVVQARGILVLVIQMPWDDCRGLALWDPGRGGDLDLVPTIVINREDAYVARTFTLFHEYGHLLLRESATCLEAQNDTSQGKVERWCNKFSAAFLVPADYLQEEIRQRPKLRAVSEWTMEDIRRAAAWFRVSRSVMARRLQELGLSDFYSKNSSTLHALDRMPAPSKNDDETGGGVRPAVKKFAEVGAVAGIVLNAVRNETISAFEAADALDIGINTLPELETLVVSRRIRTFGA